MLLSLPVTLLVYVLSRLLWKRAGAVPGEALTRLKVSQGAALRAAPRTLSARLIHLPGALRVAAIVLVGLALGRPQRVDAPDALELSGIDHPARGRQGGGG